MGDEDLAVAIAELAAAMLLGFAVRSLWVGNELGPIGGFTVEVRHKRARAAMAAHAG